MTLFNFLGLGFLLFSTPTFPLLLRSQVGSTDLNYCTPFNLGTVILFLTSGSLRGHCMQISCNARFAFVS